MDVNCDPRIELKDGCWLWRWSVNSSGYGPHRRFYEQLVGPIPTGLTLDHLCNIRRCVNPEHLEPVTFKENRRRAAARITHCPRGHEYTEDNTYWHHGTRECAACVIARNGAYARRKREERASR